MLKKLQKLRKEIISKDIFLAIAVASLVIITGVFLGWENNKIVLVNPAPSAHYTHGGNAALSFMSNWDGPDYIQIAKQGYTDSNEANFFPLYPVAVHFISEIIGSLLYSALLAAWVSMFGAVYFYQKIIKHLWHITDNLEALKGVLLFVLFPTGVFLLATYTESLFAFLSLGAIYFALKKKYLPAALMTMLATATHVTGLFILVLVLAILAEYHEKLSRIIITLVIGSLGLVSYMIFLQAKFKNAFLFISAQKSHGWLQHGYLYHLSSTIDIYNVVAIILLIASVVYWWKRRKSFALYSFLYLCIPLIGGQFGGFNRYVLMAFPIQLMLYGRFRDSKLAYSVIVALFAVFWCYFMLQYAGGYVGG